MKYKLFLSLIVFIVLEILVILTAGIVPLFAHYKMALTGDIISYWLQVNIYHPIETIQSFINQKNPIFFIGTAFNFLYSLYLSIKVNRKNKYKLADKYGVHGSSRWAKDNEIEVQGETMVVPARQLMNDLLESIKESGDGKHE